MRAILFRGTKANPLVSGLSVAASWLPGGWSVVGARRAAIQLVALPRKDAVRQFRKLPRTCAYFPARSPTRYRLAPVVVLRLRVTTGQRHHWWAYPSCADCLAASPHRLSAPYGCGRGWYLCGLGIRQVSLCSPSETTKALSHTLGHSAFSRTEPPTRLELNSSLPCFLSRVSGSVRCRTRRGIPPYHPATSHS